MGELPNNTANKKVLTSLYYCNGRNFIINNEYYIEIITSCPMDRNPDTYMEAGITMKI
ncbi:hypothetical protein [Lysinibacillus sp. S2017]|uniref:hypothetical protein n=1 Tax=Lysinibacillus sp. S2017 TaxID=2561923 RepID=UPI001F0DB5B1|nr:hypothetical protein [Lysinibacillus sp. S2017]